MEKEAEGGTKDSTVQGVQTMSSALLATRSARRTAVGEVNGRNDTLNLKMQNEERTW
jgi:hypothetical protein